MPRQPFERSITARARAPLPRPAAVVSVAAGGALGGAARYGVDRLLETPPGAVPWSTFTVNVAGSFVLAVLLVLMLEAWPPQRHLRPFLAVGCLGSFTTFSTWMVETNNLAVDASYALAGAYLSGSLVAGLGAAAFGVVLTRALTSRRHPSSAREHR